MKTRSASSSTGTNIIDEVKTDHEELKMYYNNYRHASTETDANMWFNQFVWELCRHSVGEELILYPLMESINQQGRQLADKARQDHHKVKELLTDIQSDSNAKSFRQKMESLMKDLQQHMNEEENEDLVFLRQHCSQEQLQHACTQFNNRKKIAPTRPHTSIPEKPAALEAALGLLIAPIDKMRDMFTSFPDDPNLSKPEKP